MLRARTICSDIRRTLFGWREFGSCHFSSIAILRNRLMCPGCFFDFACLLICDLLRNALLLVSHAICPLRAPSQTQPWPSRNSVRPADIDELLQPKMLATEVRQITVPLGTCSDLCLRANFLLLNTPPAWLRAVPDHSAAAFSTYRLRRSEPGPLSRLSCSLLPQSPCLFLRVDASFDPSRKTPSSPRRRHWRSFSESRTRSCAALSKRTRHLRRVCTQTF